MGKLFGTDFQVVCPKCKGIMRVRRRTPHLLRQGCETQTIECANCTYATMQIVDADGRELPHADISPRGLARRSTERPRTPLQLAVPFEGGPALIPRGLLQN
jgi:hypothetical protein